MWRSVMETGGSAKWSQIVMIKKPMCNVTEIKGGTRSEINTNGSSSKISWKTLRLWKMKFKPLSYVHPVYKVCTVQAKDLP